MLWYPIVYAPRLALTPIDVVCLRFHLQNWFIFVLFPVTRSWWVKFTRFQRISTVESIICSFIPNIFAQDTGVVSARALICLARERLIIPISRMMQVQRFVIQNYRLSAIRVQFRSHAFCVWNLGLKSQLRRWGKRRSCWHSLRHASCRSTTFQFLSDRMSKQQA